MDRRSRETDVSLICVWATYRCMTLSELLNFSYSVVNCKMGTRIKSSKVRNEHETTGCKALAAQCLAHGKSSRNVNCMLLSLLVYYYHLQLKTVQGTCLWNQEVH